MLESALNLIEQPYEEAKKELKCILTNVVEAGETPTDKKISMLRYVAEFSSEDEPVTNKDMLGAIGILKKDDWHRRLSNSMGKIQSALTAYIGHDGTRSLTKYYLRDEVLRAYEAKHGVRLRDDFLEILDELLEDQTTMPESYEFGSLFPEITPGML